MVKISTITVQYIVNLNFDDLIVATLLHARSLRQIIVKVNAIKFCPVMPLLGSNVFTCASMI